MAKKKDNKKKTLPEGNFIVKVQIPVATNASPDQPTVLIYNEDRSYETMVHLDNFIVQRMNGSYKKYFNAFLDGDQKLVLGLAAQGEGW